MKILRREIHPQVRVLDEQNGIAEFIASDETLDSYNEIIRAAGWQFNRVQKNFPFVDSHDYSTIEKCLGKVVDFAVRSKQLINTVQYALSVPEARLAQFAWKMLCAKMLPAVSVGFMPVTFLTRWDANDARYADAWKEQLEDLKLLPDTQVNCIYIVQEQLELSQCVIGANPNAVAIERAYQAGILNDSDVAHFSRLSPDFARLFERRNHGARSYSFGSAASRTSFADALTAKVGRLGGDPSPSNHQPQSTMQTKTPPENDFWRLRPENKAALEQLEFARRNQDEAGLERALSRASAALTRERRLAGDPVERHLSAHPIHRYLLNGVARKLARLKMDTRTPEYEVLKAFAPGLVSGDPLGQWLFPWPISPDIWDLMLIYGAFRDLGVSQMPSQYTGFVVVTALPTVYQIPSDQQGYPAVPPDATLAGRSVPALPQNAIMAAQVCNTIMTLISASRELMLDQKIDLAGALMRIILQAISASIDYCALQGNGADDLTNARQTGIFLDPAIGTYQPAQPGKSQIGMLTREDFINTVGVVTPAALQRPCRWFISPALIPKLMLLEDGVGPHYLLKTPARDWRGMASRRIPGHVGGRRSCRPPGRREDCGLWRAEFLHGWHPRSFRADFVR